MPRTRIQCEGRTKSGAQCRQRAKFDYCQRCGEPTPRHPATNQLYRDRFGNLVKGEKVKINLCAVHFYADECAHGERGQA